MFKFFYIQFSFIKLLRKVLLVTGISTKTIIAMAALSAIPVRVARAPTLGLIAAPGGAEERVLLGSADPWPGVERCH